MEPSKKIQVQTGVTFAVCDAPLATAPYADLPYQEAIQQNLQHQVLAYSQRYERLIPSQHGFFGGCI